MRLGIGALVCVWTALLGLSSVGLSLGSPEVSGAEGALGSLRVGLGGRVCFFASQDQPFVRKDGLTVVTKGSVSFGTVDHARVWRIFDQGVNFDWLPTDPFALGENFEALYENGAPAFDTKDCEASVRPSDAFGELLALGPRDEYGTLFSWIRVWFERGEGISGLSPKLASLKSETELMRATLDRFFVGQSWESKYERFGYYVSEVQRRAPGVMLDLSIIRDPRYESQEAGAKLRTEARVLSAISKAITDLQMKREFLERYLAEGH